MRNILQAVWWLMLQVATWVWLLAAASLQGVDDSDMELLQQAGSRTRVSAVLQCRDHRLSLVDLERQIVISSLVRCDCAGLEWAHVWDQLNGGVQTCNCLSSCHYMKYALLSHCMHAVLMSVVAL